MSDPSNGPVKPAIDPRLIMAGKICGSTNFSHSPLDCLQQVPSPGIVIFVHGVNSDGEWYHQSEEGLCKGLNTRLKRCDEHLAYPSVEGGQLWPVTYRRELTDDGFVDPDRTPNTFIADAGHHSPVIQFRWGYKASDLELQEYGASIYLNEYDYWGGGPFANGCSSLPDLWGNGLLDSLFLWIHIEHLNPLNDAMVFSAPPRPYFVLAALRLAKLVESIRKEQADVPITLVCHSQGNMIGMAAAFLGDKMADVQDAAGIKGRCVADTYVLCNPPYSVLEDNSTEDWVQGQEADPDGNVGRQTCQARIETLKNFFKIVGQQADVPPHSAALAQMAANHAHGFTLDSDSNKYRCGPVTTTRGKVTLYCNPHDQIISSTAIQGMGWRGLCAAEIQAAQGKNVFTQRVFSQGYPVGKPGIYDYWSKQHNHPERGSLDFWVPHSKIADYSSQKGRLANSTGSGRAMTQVAALALIPLTKGAGVRINALPPRDWSIPVNAPALPEPFLPQAVQYGVASEDFDQLYNPRGSLRDPRRSHAAGDPYHALSDEQIGAPKGDRDSHATMLYEDHARVRLMAKRTGRTPMGEKVSEEDMPATASEEHKRWRGDIITANLAANLDTHATDHSTIMTNGMHAEKALAYDVAVGVSHIQEKALRKLRVIADWRLLKNLDDSHSHKIFYEYFRTGKFKTMSVFDWVHSPGSTGALPDSIVNKRRNSRWKDH